MWTVVSALKSELSPLFNYFPVKQKIPIRGGSLYISNNLHLLRVGVGPEKASEVFGAYLNIYQPEVVVNLGLVGALSAVCTPGRVYSVQQAVDQRTDQVLYLNSLSPEAKFSAEKILTVDRAVTDVQTRDNLYKKYAANLVDMEAFHLAQIAASSDTPFYSFKIVSDIADHQAEKMFLNNYKVLSKTLCESIVPFLR